MRLAKDGILQFPSGQSTATLQIQNNATGFGGIMAWYKNGVFQENPAAGLTSRTINSGDTFYIVIAAFFAEDYVTIDYSLNGTYVTSYTDINNVTTPTYTATAGDIYLFTGYLGV